MLSILVSADITFNVTEVLVEATDPRLFFTVGNQEDLVGEGVFQFTAPDTNITVPIMAYTRVSYTMNMYLLHR